MRLSLRSCVPALAVVGASLVAASLSAQPATFVYKLGADTLAIEQYTRSATSITGEMVQRSGGPVAMTKYSVSMGTNGRPTAATIKRMQPDGTPFPNAPTETRFTLRADSAIREVVFADSVQRRAFAAKNAMVNFPVFAYGPTELLAMLKKSGASVDSLPAIGVGGGMGYTGLEPLAGDTLRMRGAPYAMVLRFDANSRMQLMDGSKTTNKSVAARSAGTLDVAAIARTMKPTGVLSARDVARAAFGAGGMVLIDYSKPHVRERSVWGGTLVPFDSVWRAGANDATHLMTTRTLTIGDMTLAPGTYTLWVQHTHNGTYLIVNRQIGQWGTQYNAANDIGRVLMQMGSTPSHVEEMTIAVKAQSGNRGVIEMAWGPSVMSVPFAVVNNAGSAGSSVAVDAIKSNWQGMIKNITLAAEELSEADYKYKPIATVRSFGELIGHVAGTQNLICATVLGDKPAAEDAIEKTATTKAALVKALKESNAYCERAHAISDEAGSASVQLFGGSYSKLGALTLNAVHDGEHYGNIVTYMRMKGMVPPSSRR